MDKAVVHNASVWRSDLAVQVFYEYWIAQQP
jgi:hypothetical protein